MSPIEKIKKNKKKLLTPIVTIIMILAMVLTSTIFVDNTVKGAQNWADNNFLYRKKCTIASTYIDSDLSDFPVMVKITNDADMYSLVQSDGADVVFYDFYDNSTMLDFELVYFSDSGSQINGVWFVNISTVYSSHDTYVWMYYGDNDCGFHDDPENTWDDNYLAVWHLENTTDSTSNDYDLTEGCTNKTTGIAGNCYDFEASFKDRLTHGTLLDTYPNSMTFEAFIDREAPGVLHTVMSKFSDGNDYAVFQVRTNNSIQFWGEDDGAAYAEATDGTADTGWQYVAFKGTDGGDICLYINTTNESGASFQDINDGTDYDFGLGYYTYNGNDPFDGLIDEVRLSSSHRSDAWIKASYRSVNNDLVTLGNQETDASAVSQVLHDNTLTHQGELGNTTYSNESGTYYEWYEWNVSFNGTQEIEYIRLNVTNIHANITSNYCAYQFTSDNSSWNQAGNWKSGASGGYTIWLNDTTWTTANACYGTDPFDTDVDGDSINGINNNCSVWMVERVTIPSGIGNETYSTTTGTSRTWDAGHYS